MTIVKTKDSQYPIKEFKTAEEYEGWLKEMHDKEEGVWLKFAKKASGVTTVVYAEALDISLCYGWIDGQSKRFDEVYYLQKFTPRGKRSIWSKINRENVERLIKAGKMRASGLERIEEAKADGRWDAAYDSPKTMEIPEYFLKELKKDKKAYDFFLTLNKTNTYAIAWRLQTAKKEETRFRRMNEIIALLHEEKKFH